ncbi:hypothetical protein NO1_1370 [Candidatus Termititenax aidoneus]|uniref:Uncharacterized protein n=1 Tax=Termititenax aidoneus TaxID=2218524 RepID=A0A388TCP6_TERA1|nr:hypothetical protein NO1_1370 [Candidatus Termititenax aidoneus]
MTEAEATKKIIDELYAVREQIYNDTKNLSEKEYVLYFNNNAQNIIKRSGYRAVYLNDGSGYKIEKN